MSRLFFDSKVDQGTAIIHNYEHLNAAVYLLDSTIGNKPAAAGFSGKRSKPDFHYWFMNEEQRRNRINSWLGGLEFRKADHDKRQAERKAYEHDFTVGTILNTSWGYDQTNVEFFQVVGVKSKKTVAIREIAMDSESREGFSSMSSHVTPCPNHFIGDVMEKRVGKYGVKIHSSATAQKWGGTPQYCSWYA